MKAEQCRQPFQIEEILIPLPLKTHKVDNTYDYFIFLKYFIDAVSVILAIPNNRCKL